MKRAACCILFFLVAATRAWAGDVGVDGAWARASAGVNGIGAVFLTIHNAGKSSDKVVAASSPVAKTVELHTHTEINGVMTMRKVDSIDVEAGQTVELKPGGLHIMLLSLQAPLKEGDVFPVTLSFEKSEPVTVTARVGGVSDMGGHSMEHHHHPMDEGTR